MAIFSRRNLQDMINENAKILSIDHLNKHIRALNKADESSLSFEWEIALIYGFNKLGKVIHEPNFLKGTRKIDLYFTLDSEYQRPLIADITTVSDKGYDADNPQEDFVKQLYKMIRKYNLRIECFSLEIEGKFEGPYHDRKMSLMLPEKGKLNSAFDKKFREYMRTIVKKPLETHSFLNQTNSINISISYNPKQRDGFSLGYPAYNVAYSLERNPIYNALNKKADQLKEINKHKGLISIILCDGGCRLLRDIGHRVTNYDIRDIVRNFLRKNSSISFVLTFTVERAHSNFRLMGKPYIKMHMFTSLPEEKIGRDLLARINKLTNVLSKPINDARNAINHLRSKRRNEGLSFYGGLTMTKNTVRISSRGLHELLAGRVEQKKYLEDHQYVKNFFESKLNEGKMIKEIKVEKSKEEDDDWLEIKFGEPDPAISDFKVSKCKEI